jgi:Disulphide bond corrector protein DsbC
VFRCAILVFAGLATWLQVFKDPPLPMSAPTAVQFLSPANVDVPAQHSTEIDLHFRVANGLHINSHAPLEKSLIPARLAVVEVAGLNVTAVDFPPGTGYALQFSREKLSVYTGEFVLRAHVTAERGEHVLEAGLHYQACDNNSCMPPHTIPVSVTVVGK